MDYYPRPQLERNEWTCLDGRWSFAFDDNHRGLAESWYLEHVFDRSIEVPFAYQCAASGIGDQDVHDWVWYERSVQVKGPFSGRIVRLHIGACDYETTVWVNGQHVGDHTGGQTPFCFDIERLLGQDGDARITMLVRDRSLDTTIPRGKQSFTGRSEGIFYTNTTGIWQSVWLEILNTSHIEEIQFTPDTLSNTVRMELTLQSTASSRIHTRILRGNEIVVEDNAEVTEEDSFVATYSIADFNDHHYGYWWSPDSPHLYDVQIELWANGEVADSVHSYFGIRSFSVENGKFCLNHMPFYTRSILYQGYYPESLLTAKSDAELESDVRLIKEMGFNSVRLHQKFENPRLLYWCDKLGLVVWGEAPNAFSYSRHGSERLVREWMDIIRRDYSHPCIGAWVPINESWGIPSMKNIPEQRWFSKAMHALTKSLDPTRPVMSNDGWEHTDSDLCTVHDYDSDCDMLRARYSDMRNVLPGPQGRPIYVGDGEYHGEPVLLTEFGGIAFDSNYYGAKAWGYSGADDAEAFAKQVTDIISTVRSIPLLQGYCYTQFNDTEQEVNGLVTIGRKPKIDVTQVAAANGCV
ncbi:sugar-binding domain-containing protein [Bifidobacterium sp. SO4]|uniref:glycoside hydrolase family 2 protein n=1 Tax=Bifidobacterium sp. SO4 TaxID=2809030 RepID=UPI001BDCBB78|nr:sugar-binding domain-containing protein [Bifidobacterium sp. SO4]MBT1170632.1 hypothetical protein [Bifidobacterium sp. SO4]